MAVGTVWPGLARGQGVADRVVDSFRSGPPCRAAFVCRDDQTAAGWRRASSNAPRARFQVTTEGSMSFLETGLVKQANRRTSACGRSTRAERTYKPTWEVPEVGCLRNGIDAVRKLSTLAEEPSLMATVAARRTSQQTAFRGAAMRRATCAGWCRHQAVSFKPSASNRQLQAVSFKPFWPS